MLELLDGHCINMLFFQTGDKTAALEAVAALASSSRTTEESATGKQGLYRVFKLLVQNGFFNNKEKKLEGESIRYYKLKIIPFPQDLFLRKENG